MSEGAPEHNGPGSEGEDYEVGYGRPPEHTRFRPGRSGNPRGRPKGSRGLDATLRDVLGEKIPVSVNGRKRRVSSETAILLRLREQALKGDIRSARLLLDMRRGYLADHEADGEHRPLSQDDMAILAEAGLSLSPERDDDSV